MMTIRPIVITIGWMSRMTRRTGATDQGKDLAGFRGSGGDKPGFGNGAGGKAVGYQSQGCKGCFTGDDCGDVLLCSTSIGDGAAHKDKRADEEG